MSVLSLSSGVDVMMQLGGFQFGVSTAAYQNLRRSTEWRWASQDRFGNRAALQHTGPGADTITLEGVVFTEYRGGFGQVTDLRAIGDSGQPQTLVDGSGNVMGRWVVERVDEGQTFFLGAGLPRRQEFTVQLKKFDDSAVIGAVPGVTSALGGGLATLISSLFS